MGEKNKTESSAPGFNTFDTALDGLTSGKEMSDALSEMKGKKATADGVLADYLKILP